MEYPTHAEAMRTITGRMQASLAADGCAVPKTGDLAIAQWAQRVEQSIATSHEQTRAEMTPVAVADTPDTKATWMDIECQALGHAYSPSSVAPDFLEVLRAYQSRSDSARSHLGEGEVLRYGPGERESVRLYQAAKAGSPLLVFIHGGYWQEGSADMSLFPAPDLVQAGVSFAAIGYSLAPQCSVEAMVEQCAVALAALARLYRSRHPHARIVLSGSSAGAHLAAMMMAVDWRTHGLEDPPFASMVLLSGVYDLRPLVPTYINEPLRLDTVRALQCSPLFLPWPAAVPCTLAWGEREPPEFRQQSERLGRRLNRPDRPDIGATLLQIPARDHFDIVFDLSTVDTSLGHAVRAQLEI